MRQSQDIQVPLERMSGIVYGVRIQGDLPVEFRPYLLSPAETGRHLRCLEVSCQLIHELPPAEECWVQERGVGNAKSRFALSKRSDGYDLTVRCQGNGVFRFATEGVAIEWLPGGTGPAHYFFSYALPLWLELQGVPVLHASAVASGDRAVAFMGPSGSGKSTLCVALNDRGWDFVADDGLPLSEDEHGDWRCLAAPPLFRLWPNTLEHLVGPSSTWPKVHEAFEKRAVSVVARYTPTQIEPPALASVYVLEREPKTTGEVQITTCTGYEPLIHLVQGSVAASPSAALGLTASRFKKLSRVAELTSVKHLRYPSGSEHWKRIAMAVADDLGIGSLVQSPRP